MQKYAKEHNMKMIGTDMGLVAPPPCDPQPACQLYEGSGGMLGEAPDPYMVALLSQYCNAYRGHLCNFDRSTSGLRCARFTSRSKSREELAAFLN